MSLNLRKFDPRKMRSDSIVLLIGKRNVGKSFCLKHIMSFHQTIRNGIVVSPTEKTDHFYASWVPKNMLFNEYNEDMIAKFVESQKNIVIKGNSVGHAFLILDNCSHEVDWGKSESMKTIFLNGRQLRVMMLITMPYSLELLPQLSASVDYVFIFKESNVRNKQRLYQHYAGMFPSFQVFSQIMDECTDNFECIVIDNTVPSNKIEDTVYRFKACET